MKSTYPYAMPFKWEQIYHREGDLEKGKIMGAVYRAQVIGGWLIEREKIIVDNGKIIPFIALQFIPDPEHVWKITEDKQ